MKSNRCPLCGGKTTEHAEDSHFKSVDGERVPVKNYYRKCQSCSEMTLNEEKSYKALSKARLAHYKDATSYLIDSISAKQPSISYVERSLGLPQRTFNRWKNDGGSTSSFLILKLLDTFPFIVDVAKDNFDRLAADMAILKESSLAFERASLACNLEGKIIAGTVNQTNVVMFTTSPLPVSSGTEIEMSGFPELGTQLYVGVSR